MAIFNSYGVNLHFPMFFPIVSPGVFPFSYGFPNFPSLGTVYAVNAFRKPHSSEPRLDLWASTQGRGKEQKVARHSGYPLVRSKNYGKWPVLLKIAIEHDNFY